LSPRKVDESSKTIPNTSSVVPNAVCNLELWVLVQRAILEVTIPLIAVDTSIVASVSESVSSLNHHRGVWQGVRTASGWVCILAFCSPRLTPPGHLIALRERIVNHGWIYIPESVVGRPVALTIVVLIARVAVAELVPSVVTLPTRLFATQTPKITVDKPFMIFFRRVENTHTA
jgi:hypothetical protein